MEQVGINVSMRRLIVAIVLAAQQSAIPESILALSAHRHVCCCIGLRNERRYADGSVAERCPCSWELGIKKKPRFPKCRRRAVCQIARNGVRIVPIRGSAKQVKQRGVSAPSVGAANSMQGLDKLGDEAVNKHTASWRDELWQGLAMQSWYKGPAHDDGWRQESNSSQGRS